VNYGAIPVIINYLKNQLKPPNNMEAQKIIGYNYVCEFVYSGCGKREYFTKEFTAVNGDELNRIVNEYVKNQNAGEAKSDRIRRNGIISRTEINNTTKNKTP